MIDCTTFNYWKNLLLKRGFNEPFARPDALSDTLFVFKKDDFEILLRSRDLEFHKFPCVLIEYHGIRIQVSNSDELENIVSVIDAIENPDAAYFCFNIPWAADLIEELVKHPLIKKEPQLRLSGHGKIIA